MLERIKRWMGFGVYPVDLTQDCTCGMFEGKCVNTITQYEDGRIIMPTFREMLKCRKCLELVKGKIHK